MSKKCCLKYEADHIEKVIYIDPKSLKKAGLIENPEFKAYMDLVATLPGYKVEPKKFETKKQTYAGLDFNTMRAIIILNTPDNGEREKALAEFDAQQALAAIMGASYGITKKWFLKKYAKFYTNDFEVNGTKRQSYIDKIISDYEQKKTANAASIEQ